jgi:cytochrome c nitrite reductase small subunit
MPVVSRCYAAAPHADGVVFDLLYGTTPRCLRAPGETMNASRGIVTLPTLIATVFVGAAAGIGGYTFVYAKGSSYATDDPVACSNCHVMQAQYDGWRRGPHHAVAVCNDCHTPANPISKYVVKAINGYHHSMAFTMGGFPDVIQARPMSKDVVEANCRRCHGALVEDVAHGRDVSCVRCHANVGHLR